MVRCGARRGRWLGNSVGERPGRGERQALSNARTSVPDSLRNICSETWWGREGASLLQKAGVEVIAAHGLGRDATVGPRWLVRCQHRGGDGAILGAGVCLRPILAARRCLMSRRHLLVLVALGSVIASCRSTAGRRRPGHAGGPSGLDRRDDGAPGDGDPRSAARDRQRRDGPPGVRPGHHQRLHHPGHPDGPRRAHAGGSLPVAAGGRRAGGGDAAAARPHADGAGPRLRGAGGRGRRGWFRPTRSRSASATASPTTLPPTPNSPRSSAAVRSPARSWPSIPLPRSSSPRPCAGAAGSTPTAAAMPRTIAPSAWPSTAPAS